MVGWKFIATKQTNTPERGSMFLRVKILRSAGLFQRIPFGLRRRRLLERS
jgi:hypothetical protein